MHSEGLHMTSSNFLPEVYLLSFSNMALIKYFIIESNGSEYSEFP